MRAGRLRHRVQLQQVTETRDVYGGVVRSWTTFARPWASVEPLSGNELLKAQQVIAGVTHRVRLRHRDGITASLRFVHRGRNLNIKGFVNPEERNRELECMCMEETP